MASRELLQQSLDALEGTDLGLHYATITALREALNAPEPEPYGHVTTHTVTGQQFFYRYPSPPYLDTAKECIAVYAAPPAAPDHLRDIAEKVAPAAPLPDGLATNADEVICPNCAHQFRAIPENVQSLLLASGHEPPFTTPPAAPVVPQPAQRTADCLMCGHCAATGERVAKPAVPLTDEQIRSMWKSSEFRGNGGQVDWFCEGIRAAEAHHGITGASK